MIEQLYQEALVALIAGITTKDSEGIWWESNGKPIQIKQFGKQFRIIEEDNKYWYLNDKLHRTDGHAVEDIDGIKLWFLNGRLHRNDGPAVEFSDNHEEWWINGVRHREDGPAIDSHYKEEWWLKGVQYTREEFNKVTLRWPNG